MQTRPRVIRWTKPISPAAFEGLRAVTCKFLGFTNSNTNDHVFTADVNEISALRNDNNFVEEGVVFNLLVKK